MSARVSNNYDNQCWRQLVNASRYEVEADMVFFASKAVRSVPERLRGFATRRYINPRYLFTFPLLQRSVDSLLTYLTPKTLTSNMQQWRLHRAAHKLASEEVILELIMKKCIPVLLYGLEVCDLPKRSRRIRREPGQEVVL